MIMSYRLIQLSTKLQQYKVKLKAFIKSKVDPEFCQLAASLHVNRRYYCSNDTKTRLQLGPSLKDFISSNRQNNHLSSQTLEEDIIQNYSFNDGKNRKVFIETYGCQMNVNDTEIALSVLLNNGFQRASSFFDADVILIMTCSIREGAEEKIRKRLQYYKNLKNTRQYDTGQPLLKIGVLGCMAERLKTKLLEQEKMVDLLCGPDAYRDLPRLLAITDSNQTAANVQLSLEETYADISPVRINTGSKSAFVSIMRGCDNMCSYCIVPFTRGRERSRQISSIRNEVKMLASEGIKEVVLLGQNVNSFRDTSENNFGSKHEEYSLSAGFNTIYKAKSGGLRFADLLDVVSSDNPEMRFRFTSPHPKDFPDEVLHLIRDRPNICKQIHLPAQSGNTEMLDRMRRGYTREAYLELVEHIRDLIPDISLSSDFIAGFCGETETDHQETLSLLKIVKYSFCYCFPYSMREKTRAYHRLVDDVDREVKLRRMRELVSTFREISHNLHLSQVGQKQLVLVEGDSKRSSDDLAGRNDGNTKVIFPKSSVPTECNISTSLQLIAPGDFVVVEITDCTSQVLKGVPLYHSSIAKFSNE